MTVNGIAVSHAVEDRTLLVTYIREHLRLTGTHIGCDTSQCGACVVSFNGKAVKSCTMLAAQADGSQITTIEGLADGEQLHPVQAAFKEHHGLQCVRRPAPCHYSGWRPPTTLPQIITRSPVNLHLAPRHFHPETVGWFACFGRFLEALFFVLAAHQKSVNRSILCLPIRPEKQPLAQSR
ncbi:UNVERIFIED_CONTAM: hypothetical protein GTU68_064738 [Idotea baltica]|nr:hypothetical protein [Idotea baltica]